MEDTTEKIDLLEREIVRLKQENASHEQNQVESIQVIEELKTELASAMQMKANASAKPTVVVDGVTYQINHGSAPHTAKELSEKPEVCREILAIEGQNALTKL